MKTKHREYASPRFTLAVLFVVMLAAFLLPGCGSTDCVKRDAIGPTVDALTTDLEARLRADLAAGACAPEAFDIQIQEIYLLRHVVLGNPSDPVSFPDPVTPQVPALPR